MTEKERLLDALFPKGEDAQIVNLKFLARDLSITEDELCREFLEAREEFRSEQVLKMPKAGPHINSKPSQFE